jgi:uncharacterized OB-fold protein
MTNETAIEPAFYEQTWDLSYRHALGQTTSRFLAGLRDGKILGRTTVEGRVIVPPRAYDDRTHTETGEWVEVANEGVIEMFTIVYEPFRGLPAPPYALAYALLDGADTALVGYVRGLDLSDSGKAATALKEARVVVKYAAEPSGTAADYWFELAN